jgi:transporter family protein
MWTLLGAVLIYSEQLNWRQWLGIGISMVFFYLFTLIGNKEGVSFRKNKWVLFIMAATLIGAASGLYDKFLIRKVNNMAVQAWFSIYMIPVILPFVYFFWYRKLGRTTPFQFRYTIPLIGITLTIADFCYFYALTDESSLIAIVSSLRRTSVLVTFFLGALLFKEKNIARKLLLLIGMLLGVLIIVWGSV